MPNLTMPNVGEGVTEGTVTRWLKQEGDTVAKEEPVVEVETDKAVVEIPSPFEGTLSKILVAEGTVVPIGTPLAEFASSSQADATPSTPAESPAVASMTPNTEDAAEAADDVRPAHVAKASRTNGAVPAVSAGHAARPAPPPGSDGLHRTRQYSPVVLKLAGEHNIDLTLVRGTGIEGRVTRQDVMAYIENPIMHTVPPPDGSGVVGVPAKSAGSTQSAPSPAARPAAPTAPAEPAAQRDRTAGGDATSSADDERVPITPTRRTIAARMLESHQTVPVAWMMVEADVSELVALRARAKEEFQRAEGVNLTYMPFFVRTIVGALKQHPAVNATFEEDAIVVHRRHDIGIAMAVDSGLVVPVIRDAERSSIVGLSHQLDELGQKARARRLTVDDMRGATFTIDNTGAFGSLVSQPIIPPGQAAIITTEAIRRELRVADDGSFAVRHVLNLCISFDHRALDGAEIGLFMRAVKDGLEAARRDEKVY